MRRAVALPLVLALAGCGGAASSRPAATTHAPTRLAAPRTSFFDRRHEGALARRNEIDRYTFTIAPRTWLYLRGDAVRGMCGARNRTYRWTLAPAAGAAAVFRDQPLYAFGFCRWFGPRYFTRGGRYVLTVRAPFGDTGRYAFTVWKPHVDRFNVRLGAFVGPGHPAHGAGVLEVPGSFDLYHFRAPENTRLVLDAREVDGYCGKGAMLHWTVYSETTKRVVLPDAAMYGTSKCYDQGPIDLAGGVYDVTVYGSNGEIARYSFLLVPVRP